MIQSPTHGTLVVGDFVGVTLSNGFEATGEIERICTDARGKRTFWVNGQGFAHRRCFYLPRPHEIEQHCREYRRKDRQRKRQSDPSQAPKFVKHVTRFKAVAK